MANITLMGASYTDVPAVDLPKTGGGTVRFYENGGGGMSVSDIPNSTGTGTVVTGTVLSNLITKSITQNGTYDAEDDNADGYSSVTVNVTNQDYNDALTAFGVQSNLASGITALTTYANEITGESDTTLSDAVRSLADGYGVKVKAGTFTPSETYNTTGNRLIVSLANIGFTPTKFVLQLADLASVNATQYAVIESSYEKCGDGNTPYYLRKTVRYSNTSGTIGANISTTAWTTQTNYYLYNDSTNIYLRTTNTFVLLKDKVYRWIAYE